MSEYNGVMMQFFQWYTNADGALWREVAEQVIHLVEAGITSLWLPPAYKGAGGKDDVGYGVYDLFDLGEFDQKGSIRTKYGTREEYLEAIRIAHEAGLQVYGDVVMNHRLGGDNPEEFNATPYNPDNRKELLGEMRKIRAWTNFTYPGRAGKHSQFEWHWHHFNATDTNEFDKDMRAVYLFEGKSFNENVDKEKGNFDFLMGCDVDVDNPDVKEELIRWGKWYLDTTGVDGFRFDAVKHVSAEFFVEWLGRMREHAGRDIFAVGEYWTGVEESLKYSLNATDRNLKLFDAVLHFNFADASKAGNAYDLRKIFDRSLVQSNPEVAVTLVSNHDTQPLQALESTVEAWFTPLAYAVILLRRGGYPCIFHPDYYGAEYRGKGHDGNDCDIKIPSHKWLIDRFLDVRRRFAFGDEHDYFDDPNCIGWTRTGDKEHPGGIAVLLSNDAESKKSMKMGMPRVTYKDITEHIKETVTTNNDGWGEFRCAGRAESVWVPVQGPSA